MYKTAVYETEEMPDYGSDDGTSYSERRVSYISGAQVGTVFIRISVPDLKVQKCLQFELDDTVWQAQQRIVSAFAQDLKNTLNYGLYYPPVNGRAGKFLEGERLLADYPLQGPIGFLEFKQKKRVYKIMYLNQRKLKQLHTKGNLRQFIAFVKHGNLSKINKLTLKGLDPNFCDPDTGETPLTLAVTLDRHKCREVILSLVSAGAHLDFRTKEGLTAMHKAAIVGSTESLKTLLDLGASPHYRDVKGLTPLYHNICKGGNPVCSEILLYEQSVTGIQDEQGWCEIHHACRQGLAQHLEHLIYYGADLNIQNASGNTPLHVCAINNMESCARVLLFRGAKKDVYNYSNQTAYQVAVMAGNKDLGELIETHKMDDVVPFKEMPKFSAKRRSVMTEKLHALARCRSDPKLNYCAEEDKYYNSSSSSQSLHVNSNKSDSMVSTGSPGYYSDSPRSLSISSNSSGPVLSVGDHGYWEGQANGKEGWFPSEHVQEVRMRHRVNGEAWSNSHMQKQRNTLATLVHPDREYEPRTVVLHKGPEGYGFVLRGAKAEAKKGELDFHPSAEFPALQYLDSVDPGSKSDKAGLKGGDFILEINGDNVIRASHDHVVHLIRSSGNTLALKVVTVKPVDRLHDWFVHQDGCMTVPSRKKAPDPPQRDPQTSLSFSKAKSKSVTNGLDETHHIDYAIHDVERRYKGDEQKTASIKARHSAKRVSCVELENIGVYDQSNALSSNNEKNKPVVSMPKDYMSPSELRIKKYHKKEHNSLERSQSSPDLQDNKSGETVYATPISTATDMNMMVSGPAPDYPGSQTHTYAIPSDKNQKLWVVSNSRPSSSRPGGPPPLPPDSPTGSMSRPAPKRQAPAPPGVEHTGKTEVVTISRKRGSVHSNSSSDLPVTEIVPQMMEESPYESSFRPGTNAKLTNEPGSVAKSHQRNLSAGRAQPHSEGQILVTADVHVSDNKQAQKNDAGFEPMPDYDSDSGDERHSKSKALDQRRPSNSDNAQVTVISIDNDGRRESLVKVDEYQKRAGVLAQINKFKESPQQVRASHYGSAQSSPRDETRKYPYERFGLETPKTSVDATASMSAVDPVSDRKDIQKSVTPAPPPIPTAPPPPPAIPRSSPGSVSQTDVSKTSESAPVRVETDSILAAVQARKARMETEGPRITENKSAVRQDSWKQKMESNQAAILAAVAKRRSILEQTTDNSVVESIESRLQKTKKLQSAKYYFTSDTISAGKEPNASPKMAPAKTSGAGPSSDSSKNKVQSKEVLVNSAKPQAPKVGNTTPVTKNIQNGHSEQKNKTSIPQTNSVTSSQRNVKLVTNTTNVVKQTAVDVTDSGEKNVNLKQSVTVGDKPTQEQSDFLAMAEKARQEYLKKKSSESPSSSTSSLESSKATLIDRSKKMDDKKTDTKSVVSTKTMKDSHIISSTTPIKDRIRNLEKNKLNQDGPKNLLQETKIISKTPGESKAGVKSASPKLNHINGDISGHQSVRGDSLPPPPGFGDTNASSKMVQLEILPPPTHFNVDQSGTDMQQYSMSFSPEDSESLVSSLSTMSTASSEHGDMWQSKQSNNFEDLIAPPPPGFDDKNNNHIDNIAIVIPPPPEFGDVSNKYGVKGTKTFDSKPVDSWLCSDVLDWLDSSKMSQYKARFQERCIDGKKLIGLSRNDYIELGVTQVGHRMSLERSIKKATLSNNSNTTYVEKL